MKETIYKFLLGLRVIEEVSNTERHKQGLKRLGKGYNVAQRLNAYNPLSYVFIICFFTAGLVMYGVIGVFKEIATHNPFKWQ